MLAGNPLGRFGDRSLAVINAHHFALVQAHETIAVRTVNNPCDLANLVQNMAQEIANVLVFELMESL